MGCLARALSCNLFITSFCILARGKPQPDQGGGKGDASVLQAVMLRMRWGTPVCLLLLLQMIDGKIFSICGEALTHFHLICG